MTVPAQLDGALLEQIKGVIRKKFDLDTASSVEVCSVEIDADEQKIRIELLITTTAEPAALAKGYLGLTGIVREALGSDWSDFFPVITPQINPGIHA